MAATLALAGTAPTPKTETRPSEAAGAAGGEGESFADAMQAQSPSGGAEAPRADQKAAASSAAPEARAGAPGKANDGDVAPEGATSAGDDAELGTDQVDTLLGMCELAPAAAPTGAAASDGTVGAPDAAAVTATGCTPPLPQPLPYMPEQRAPAADPGTKLMEGDGVALAALRAAPAPGAAIADAQRAAGLEALATSGDDDAATRPDGSANPVATAASEARGTARTAESAAPAARAAELRSPPGSPGWTDELGSRVTWMIDRGEQVASLRLTPENLGPLDIRIAVREGETTVWFGATHPDTRAALEQSLPRLREMLGASGLALANAGVFSQTPRDPQRGFTAAALARAAVEAGGDGALAGVTTITRQGLVDLYA